VIASEWGADAREAIVRALASAERGARVLFDFDNTIVRGDLGDVALLALLDHGTLARPSREAWGPLTDEAHDAIARAFGDRARVGPHEPGHAGLLALLAQVLVRETLPSGRAAFEPSRTSCLRGSYFAMAALVDALTPAERVALAERAWADASARALEATRLVEGHAVATSIRARPAMLALRTLAEDAGLEAWIVTASHEDLVRTIAPRLGFAAERVIGARPSRSLADWPRVEGAAVMTYDVGKRAHVAHHAEGMPIARALAHTPRIAIACGDADTDHAMLEDARAAIVLVDRGQPRVSALAARRRDEGHVAVVTVSHG
jgi:phosphoserine phosphatase